MKNIKNVFRKTVFGNSDTFKIFFKHFNSGASLEKQVCFLNNIYSFLRKLWNFWKCFRLWDEIEAKIGKNSLQSCSPRSPLDLDLWKKCMINLYNLINLHERWRNRSIFLPRFSNQFQRNKPTDLTAIIDGHNMRKLRYLDLMISHKRPWRLEVSIYLGCIRIENLFCS
jgi:hypothetical protein